MALNPAQPNSEVLGPDSVLVVSRSMKESLREAVSLQPRFKRGYTVTVKNCLWQQVPDSQCCAVEGALFDPW